MRERVNPPGRHRILLALLQLVASGWALSCLDTTGKWMMEAGVTLLLLCWVRYITHMLVAVTVALRAAGTPILHSSCPGRQLLRGAFMLASTLSFFTTLSYLPQAQATAINFLAPLLVLLVAPWLLREAPKLSRWLATATGFVGVLVVIRPGAELDPVGTLFGLVTACLFTGLFVTNRLIASDDPLTSLVWSGAMGSVALTLVMPLHWTQALPALQQLSTVHWLVLLSTGVWGALGHLLQIQAYRNAPASLLSPFLYVQIIAATTLGWLVWQQFPDLVSWLGIAVIIASGLPIMLQEWRRSMPGRT